MSDPFKNYAPDDVNHLITQHPLAWVCSTDGTAQASQLPLIGEVDEDGKLISLIGHLARRNPLCACLRSQSPVMVLFSGPNAYVSPEHAGVRDWAPTWNYANLHITGEAVVDEGLTAEALDVLIAVMENGRPNPWTRDEIAYRYDKMADAIIGFRIKILTINGHFKYGQDERDTVYHSIIDHLPHPDVVAQMRHFNPDR